jgi:hypothetical protein
MKAEIKWRFMAGKGMYADALKDEAMAMRALKIAGDIGGTTLQMQPHPRASSSRSITCLTGRGHEHGGASRSADGPKRVTQAGSKVVTIPPPTGGWNARDPLAEMEPEDAIVLDNIIPGGAGIAPARVCVMGDRAWLLRRKPDGIFAPFGHNKLIRCGADRDL